MTYKIGPRELFVPNTPERNNIVNQDNESAVTWYKNNFLNSPDARQRVIDSYFATTVEVDRMDKCIDGGSPELNFLISCSWNKNVTLVKFIVSHIDVKSTLNLLDPTFFQTALGYTLMIKLKRKSTPTSEYQAHCEKSYACTRILLEGGANPNVFFSFTGIEEYPYRKPDLVQSVAASVLINWTAMIEENKRDLSDEKYRQNGLTYTRYLEKMFLLFFHHEASITVCDQDAMYRAKNTTRLAMTGRQITAESKVEQSDSDYMKDIIPKCVELIKYTQINACWDKYRLLFLAARSPTSPLENIPTEVNSLIGNCLLT